MPLPTLLSRQNPKVHKNSFGHALIIAGSKTMLGAGALASLSAMRTGAGLVTWAVPKSLNTAAQKKASSVVMTWPLDETAQESFDLKAAKTVLKKLNQFSAVAIGPGLSNNIRTINFTHKIIASSPNPLVIDADAINGLAENLHVLTKSNTPKILTPHPGEMARLTGISKKTIEKNRIKTALDFSKKYKCVVLLKGHKTIVTDGKNIYVNRTGNAGMATAGSGDVLTGMITALLAQGLSTFEAARWGAYLHGKAGDIASKSYTKLSMIATDIINCIPQAVKKT